jgi:hypothetical protein
MEKILFFIFALLSLITNVSAGWQEDIIHEANIKYFPAIITIKENPAVAASADYGFNELKVELYTGLLKSPRMTPDALRMTICHELGHLYGGHPRKNAPMEWEGPRDENGMSFLSAEGQADYFAGLECFRKITSEDVKTDRIAKAGFEFLTLVFPFPISIETPDLSVSPFLIRDSYPARQCRLDTIIAGANKNSRPACWFKD